MFHDDRTAEKLEDGNAFWTRVALRFAIGFITALILLSCDSPPQRIAPTIVQATGVSQTPTNSIDSVPASIRPVVGCIASTPADSARQVLAGKRLFAQKRCTKCHTIGAGYVDGPDLEGIARRQGCDWVVALLTDTENMIQTDPELQQLRIEHFLDMPNHELSVAQARALYAYLRAAPVDSARRSGAR